MKAYILKLKIKSALGTPIMGDTIFGHLCWGIKFHEGEKKLIEFLKQYDDAPPLIISDGFPEKMLPFPLLKPSLFKDDIKLDELNRIKQLRKQKYIKSDLFFREGFIFSEENVIANLSKDDIENIRISLIKQDRLHNTINRITNTTSFGDNSLYAAEEIWYREQIDKDQYNNENIILDIYLASSFNQTRLKLLFDWAFENGYGADKSTGKGNVEVTEIKKNKLPRKGNRAVALGSFVPHEKEQLQDLRADIFTKYGKLGGTFVLSENPFKKPLIMYKAGSTFDSSDSNLFVGSLIHNIHKNESICHHAFAPVVMFKEDGSNE